MRLVILLILTLLILPSVSAAIIQGKVYDLELNRLNNVVVEIDTLPKQRIISQQGEYFFNVPQGEYIISARAVIEGFTYLVDEEVSIIDDGEYTIDLFLFPELEDIPYLDVGLDDDKKSPIVYIVAFVMVILILVFSFRLGKDKKISLESDGELENIYNLIKKKKRITQREIRKGSSLSEAKISLIITQLEKEGKIQKIKKGRSNVIILNNWLFF